MLLLRPPKRPNERRILTLGLDEKPGNRQTIASNSVRSLANVFSTPTDLRMRFARTDRSSMPRAEMGSEKRKRLVPDVEPCSKAERVQSEGVRLLRGHFYVGY